ncbi:Biopolymer transport protein ExbD/TolR [Rosistilla oblonga]|uniref:Biopolymer transport protein ExbD/TolR n=1 Tax=Rosistilla oblonga TaxID=2527990 RepID=A0A518IUS6_9BACT|nr:biopolymer transporter ExbD [Rosistilla oblonga]QDV15034.1 Biopolymer transport protein ExbD/TolR [Rosistilla oblonga]QDV56820.1 Biopolymer transport protein ExbD/TolR [Rosistilla oblonga]
MSTAAPIDEIDDDPPIMTSTRSDDDEMDITPMIDITFLLLIFFVVCSKMDPSQTTNLPLADNGLAVSAKDSAVVKMKRGTGETAELQSNDGVTFSNDPEAQLEAITRYITRERESGKAKIMLMCEKDVRSGEVTRVQKMLGDAFPEVEQTYIAVKEE